MREGIKRTLELFGIIFGCIFLTVILFHASRLEQIESHQKDHISKLYKDIDESRLEKNELHERIRELEIYIHNYQNTLSRYNLPRDMQEEIRRNVRKGHLPPLIDI